MWLEVAQCYLSSALHYSGRVVKGFGSQLASFSSHSSSSSFKTPSPCRVQMETVAPIFDVANNHPYLSVASVVLGCAALMRLARRQRSDLPPGPKGYPIAGNLFDLPSTNVWEKFAEFGERYGPLFCPRSHLGFRFFTGGCSQIRSQAKSHTSTSSVGK